MTQASEAFEELMSVPHQVIDVAIGDRALDLSSVAVEGTSSDCLDFWGLAIDEDGSFRGRLLGGPRPGFGLEVASSAAGEWTGVFPANVDGIPSYVYMSDFFGMKSAFWTCVGMPGARRLLVGNSFRAVLRAVRDRGYATNVDWATGLTTLMGTMNIFHTPHSVQTPAEGVWLLRSDEALVANRQGVGIIPRHRLFSSTLATATYETLLQRGIEKGCNGLASALDESDDPVLMLSGGKDSRTMLALALAAGVQGRLRASTHDPGIRPQGPMRDLLTEDLRIASGLAETYGLRRSGGAPRSTIAVSFEEHLSHWQKHRSGWNYVFSPGTTLSLLRQAPALQLWGAGGELMRGYFTSTLGPSTKDWDRVVAAAEQPEHALSLLYESVVPTKGMPTQIAWNGKANFITSVLTGRGSLADMVGNHYRNFRHAAHFGNRNMAYGLGTLQWYPLCQPEFVLAAQMLEDEQRVAGKAQFDVIEMAAPEVNNWELQGKQWGPLTGFSLGRLQRLPEVASASVTDASPSLRPANIMLSTDTERASRHYDRQKAVQDRVATNLTHLGHSPSASDVGLAPRTFAALVAQAHKDQARAGHLLAKSETLRDVLNPPVAAVSVLTLGDEKRTVNEWQGHPLAPAALLRWPRASVNRSGGYVAVHVRILDHHKGRVEWALYLFCDHERILATPYSQDCRSTYDVAPLATRAVLFVRAVDNHARTLLLSSELHEGLTTLR